jgi:DNA mismatch endonuclease, patch repair protein
MAFIGAKAAVFMNGCFWHGHDCPLFRLPASNKEFWRAKIDANRSRDIATLDILHGLGWRTAVVWECAMRGRPANELAALLGRLEEWIREGSSNLDIRGPLPEGMR